MNTTATSKRFVTTITEDHRTTLKSLAAIAINAGLRLKVDVFETFIRIDLQEQPRKSLTFQYGGRAIEFLRGYIDGAQHGKSRTESGTLKFTIAKTGQLFKLVHDDRLVDHEHNPAYKRETLLDIIGEIAGDSPWTVEQRDLTVA